MNRADLKIHSLEEVSGEWDELADHAGASPFLRRGWITAWLRAFGKGRLEIHSVRDGAHLIGLIPLLRHHGSLRSPTNAHTPEFGFLVRDPSAAGHLARAVVGHASEHLVIAAVGREDPGVVAMVSVAAEIRRPLLVRELGRSPYLTVRGSWERYEGQLHPKVRAEMRRRRRRLQERGRLSLEVVDGRDRLREYLDEGFRVEASGWKGRRSTAILSHPRSRGFYTDVAAWAAARGWLRLAFLRIDGRAVAFDYCLEQDGVHYLLKTGYDPSFRQFAPGMLLRREMLARAFETRLRRYEFLGVADRWKLMWTDQLRERLRIHAFSRSMPGVMGWAAVAYGRPAVRRAKGAIRAAFRR